MYAIFQRTVIWTLRIPKWIFKYRAKLFSTVQKYSNILYYSFLEKSLEACIKLDLETILNVDTL